LNCIDRDCTNSGFVIELSNHIRDNATIPVMASSGAGKLEQFSEVFKKTKAEAALAA
jgi:glutamine amidotransferase/cyclase